MTGIFDPWSVIEQYGLFLNLGNIGPKRKWIKKLRDLMMKQSKKEIEEKIIDTYVCDICNKPMRTRKCCTFCGRDICRDHRIFFDLTYLDEGRFYLGDNSYPSRSCPMCWDIGKEYRKKILDIRNIAEEQETKLLDEWNKKCIS